jgi:hypothetical protein
MAIKHFADNHVVNAQLGGQPRAGGPKTERRGLLRRRTKA